MNSMAKLKKLKLKPSARDNRRYFFVKEKKKEKIEKAILDYVGILGMAKSAYLFVDEWNEGIIGSCLREELNDILASLVFANIKVLRVSGTIEGLKTKKDLKTNPDLYKG